jgi:hypothetical protein
MELGNHLRLATHLTIQTTQNCLNIFFQKFITRLGFKLSLVLTSILFLWSFAAESQGFSLCGPNTNTPVFCARMKHLRATVNALDSQTELMQVNYEFLGALAVSLENNTKYLVELTPQEMLSHKEGLKRINSLSADFRSLANKKDAEALTTANMVKGQCLNCHTSANPTGGIPWNDVFGFSWDKISKECGRVGRNPYLCRSMNAMMTDYNHILSGYAARIEDFEITGAFAGEIARILQDLKAKGFNHLGEANRLEAEVSAQKVVALAKAQDPTVFEKARALNTTCSKCHSEISALRVKYLPGASFSPLWSSR